MIAFRTNAGPIFGIGHLARCYRLALELMRRGYECHFYLDNKSKFLSKYLQPFSCYGLYELGAEFLDEGLDASIFQKLITGRLEAVVVDDYRLSKIWECSVSSLKVPIMVLDDRSGIEHNCSILVDSKWEGDLTKTRYEANINYGCIRLLGPQYVFLDSVANEEVSRSSINVKGEFKLVLGLGGGGDMKILIGLMKNILKNAPKNIRYSLFPVIGPYSTNQKAILKFAEENNQVMPILNARSLYNHLITAHLYIGAAGGTLYEALSLGIPSVSFSLSSNQINNRSDLEDLGHYFHLEEITKDSYKKIANLAWSILLSHNRVEKLYKEHKKIELDSLGAYRVASVFDELINKSPIEALEDCPSIIELTRIHKTLSNPGYEFILVDDSHVNKYVDARNLDINLQNMTEKQEVGHLDHYIWWLNSQRISYILKKGDRPLLYIWHQKKVIQGLAVLVGGWFVCGAKCGPMDAMYALGQQIKITDKDFPGIPWIAVIKKTNKYVQNLNKRMGFKRIEYDNQYCLVIEECFPNAKNSEFDYFIRAV